MLFDSYLNIHHYAFYSTLNNCIFLFYSAFILFYSILFYSNLFYSILFYSVLFYSILFCSILIALRVVRYDYTMADRTYVSSIPMSDCMTKNKHLKFHISSTTINILKCTCNNDHPSSQTQQNLSPYKNVLKSTIDNKLTIFQRKKLSHK